MGHGDPYYAYSRPWRDPDRKWNYALDVFFDTCDAPYTAYIEAAFPAAIKAAASWYCLDPVQMFTGFVRPGTPLKGTRKGSHGRGTRHSEKGNKFWRGFKKAFNFDPNEWLAKKMPFSEDMEGRQVPGGAKWMWQGYSQWERFNNFMFMYTIVEDFFYDVALGVAQSPYCQDQRAASFAGYSERQEHFGVGHITACIIEEVRKARFVGFIGGNGVSCDYPVYTVGFSIGKAERWDGGSDFSDCYLRLNPPDGPSVRSPIADGGGSCAVATNVIGGGVTTFETEGPFSFDVIDVEFFLHANEQVPRRAPRDWCEKLADQAINWADI